MAATHHSIVHIGDTHLQASHTRHGDQLSALDQIFEHARVLAEADTLAAIVWPGDLFHTKSTIDDRNALVPRVQEFASLAPVVIVKGNHDQEGELEILARLASTYPIRVVTKPQVLHFETPTDVRIACFALPYPFKGALVAAGVEHQALSQTTREIFDPIFMTAASELEQAAAAGELPLMIGHVSVGGAISSTGQPQIGQDLEIDPAQLARLGPIYKGLSHIHKHQTVGGAVYAGSIARLDFGEMEPKGFIEVEYQRDGKTWEHRWKFVRLGVPAMHHVEGRLTREAFVFTSVDGQPTDPEASLIPSWSGADVRCRYRVAKGEVGVLDVAKIHAEFAGCRSLVLEPIAETEAAVRAPEIAAAVTLEDKVHAFAARQGLTVTAGFDHKLSLLQAQPQDRVVAAVATDVASRGRTPEPVSLGARLAAAEVEGQEVRA